MASGSYLKWPHMYEMYNTVYNMHTEVTKKEILLCLKNRDAEMSK